MVEFTGERVVPGQVNPDLWSEHIARYAFARQFAAGQAVLDAACGVGYGTAELAAEATSVAGIDISADAIEHAKQRYSRANIEFKTASCLDLPFPSEAFGLVVAFEVIEHLSDIPRFLDECARVLAPDGLFLVSTPNTLYYSESRAKTGPNPFHTHEFTGVELREELKRHFAHVQLIFQDRTECFAFHGATANGNGGAEIESGDERTEQAHFFIALCSKSNATEGRPFVYVPRAVNLLREREHHIASLDQQLDEVRADRRALGELHESLLEQHARQKLELEEHNRWALRLNAELAAVRRELVQEKQRAASDLEEKGKQVDECIRLLDLAEATVIARSEWAQQAEQRAQLANAERARLAAQLEMVRISRWVKLGRKIGLGPVLERP